MISADEVRKHAAEFGVPERQVERDHLISHVLYALSRIVPQEFTFFGGTALCRTWCRDARLSEDVDLLVEDHVVATEELTAKIAKLTNKIAELSDSVPRRSCLI